jgi:hypothetical protein
MVNYVLEEIENNVDEKMVRNICKSFIDGDPTKVPPTLLQFMNTESRERVRWIPWHMVPILSHLSRYNRVWKYSNLLLRITDLFYSFLHSKIESGEVWEKLFVITLIIRAIASTFDPVILPLHYDMFKNCFVSYHEPICKNAKTLVSQLVTPTSLPHIAIYYPKHSQFTPYDVMVVAYDEKGTSQIYGYQLKAGKTYPEKNVKVEGMHKSLWIRGVALKEAVASKGWVLPSEKEIEAFFGQSGCQWTPRAIKELEKE